MERWGWLARNAAIPALCALLTACPSEGSDPTPEGRWGLRLADGCDVGVGLYGDGTYRWALSCPLQGGGNGAEVEDGTYTYTDQAITFAPVVTSCRADDSADLWSMGWELSGWTLRLTDLSGVVILENLGDETPAGFVGRFGCWDGDLFAPGSLVPVR